MRTYTNRLLLITLLILSVSSFAFGQRNYRAADRQARQLTDQATQWVASLGDPAALIYRKDVQRDLHLGLMARNRLAVLRDQQQREIESAGGSSSRYRSEHRKETQDKIDELLTAKQKKRLKQLALQLRGESAAADPTIQKQLELTSDQRTDIQRLIANRSSQISRLRIRLARGEIQPQDLSSFVNQILKECNDGIASKLTDEQREKLKELFGPPIGDSA